MRNSPPFVVISEPAKFRSLSGILLSVIILSNSVTLLEDLLKSTETSFNELFSAKTSMKDLNAAIDFLSKEVPARNKFLNSHINLFSDKVLKSSTSSFDDKLQCESAR